jgi:hypothetical protein
MPQDEFADFTTKDARPVICQRCSESFESGTKLFFMHNRKGDGPGKHICAGCRQYYLRKTEAIKEHTLGQFSHHFLYDSQSMHGAAGHKSDHQQIVPEHQIINVTSTQKAVAVAQRQGMDFLITIFMRHQPELKTTFGR